MEKFIEAYGTVICGDIQKKLMGRSFYLFDPEHWDALEEAGGHNNVCPSVVAHARQWAAALMLEKKGDK